MCVDHSEKYAYILHGECKSITRVNLELQSNEKDYIKEKDHIVYFSLSDDS